MMKDILIRALKTFIQGFLGALAVTLPSSDWWHSCWYKCCYEFDNQFNG